MSSAVQPGVEGGGVGHLLLGDVIGEVTQRKAARRERLLVREHCGHSGLDGVRVRFGEGEEVGVALGVGEVEASDPAHGVPGVVEGDAQPLCQGTEFGACRGAVEAAEADVYGVDRASPEQFDDGVAGLFEAQPALDVRQV